MGFLRTAGARHATALGALGLALASAALYARSLGFEFVNFDDPQVLLAHPLLYDERSFASSLVQIFYAYFPREEPLLVRDVSWALDARLFGFANPFGYHLGNVLLNALDVALLFWFLARATGRRGAAFAVAAVFAVLPVHVEAVAWVMGRKDVLSAAFVLGALIAQSYELAEPDAQRRRPLFLASLLCTGLALLAKIAAFPCVVLLALHRVFAPHLDGRAAPTAPVDWPRARREVLRLWPHAAVTVAVLAWYQGQVAEAGVIGWRGHGPLDPAHLAVVASFTPLVIGSYLRSLVWPAQLSAFYRWPHVEIPLTGEEKLAAVAIAIAVVGFVAYCCLRRRDLAFFALAFLALLVPYLNLVFVDIWRADRYVYLASFCAVAIATKLLAEAGARGGAALRAGIAAAACVFALGSAAQTAVQQTVWRNSDALWAHEAALDEPSLLALQSVATAIVQRAEKEPDPARRRELALEARAQIERGLARDRALGRVPSGYATSEPLQLARLHVLLGRTGALLGEPLEAQLAHYETAHAIAPNRASAFHLAELDLALSERASGDERERLARRSWAYFLEYVSLSGRDPLQIQRNAGIAAIYEKRFPFLHDEIVAAREGRR